MLRGRGIEYLARPCRYVNSVHAPPRVRDMLLVCHTRWNALCAMGDRLPWQVLAHKTEQLLGLVSIACEEVGDLKKAFVIKRWDSVRHFDNGTG